MARRAKAGMAIAVACWLGALATLHGQGAAPAAVPTSDQVFKNIQIGTGTDGKK